MELVADLLIVSAVIMLTIMWELWIAELFTGNWKGQTFGDRLFGAGMAVGAFAFFYLSPRFLFLIEDFNRRLTWATIALTVAPLIGRILLGARPGNGTHSSGVMPSSTPEACVPIYVNQDSTGRDSGLPCRRKLRKGRSRVARRISRACRKRR